jgi:hypothetical protein
MTAEEVQQYRTSLPPAHRWPALSVTLWRRLAQWVSARREVRRAIKDGVLDAPTSVDASADVPQLTDIPSCATGNTHEGQVLAEIDQDGFAFATNRLDTGFFNRRASSLGKIRYSLHVVVHRGRVCVQKSFDRRPFRLGWRSWFWSLMGSTFYTEAVALLRLRGVPGIPVLRGIDVKSRTLYMDYVRGQSLRQVLGDEGHLVHDLELSQHPELSKLDDWNRDKREIALFHAHFGAETRREIEALVRRINAQGVAVMDVKLGNVIVGGATSALYWIDYERSQLDTYPRWEKHLAEQNWLLNHWFGISDQRAKESSPSSSPSSAVSNELVGAAGAGAGAGASQS